MEEINERPNVDECLLLDGGRFKKKILYQLQPYYTDIHFLNAYEEKNVK